MIMSSMLRDVSMARAVRRAAALALGLSALGGCAVEQAPGDEAVEEGLVPITSLRLEDGAEIRFFEPEEGSVIVVSTGEVLEPLKGQPPVAVYEALSGQAAPPALIAAQARVDEARLAAGPRRAAEGPEVEIEEALPAPQARAAEGLGTAAQAMSAASFQASYCNSTSYDFNYCWTDSSVGRTVTISSVAKIHVHADATVGSIQVKVSRKKGLGSWKTVFNQTVSTAGALDVTEYTDTENGKYEVVVSSVSAADVYHLAVHGDL
ncbi:hypothetical protein WMF18_21745 [Sorangium sp. So ce315]|uniref:hypothetical protein n=1 Tax=Sorangium sp. So ce315 TaxID=3133299 RepID=UPI003F601BDE